MAQLDGTRRLSDRETCKIPTSQNSPTFEQLIHGEAAVRPANASPIAKNHEQEEDHTTHSKKSVFTKVKEKAKKLRHSFSGKKKHGLESQDGNSPPPWGVVTLEDDEENDDNPEYHGAPMYESELAPEKFKQATSQHQQEAPVVVEGAKEKNEQPSGPIKQLTKSASEKPAPTYAAASESRTYKPIQSYSAVSDATQTVSSKIAGSEVETPEATKPGNNAGSNAASPRAAETGKHVGSTVASPRATDGSTMMSPQAVDTGKNAAKGMWKLDGSPESREHTTNTSPQTWDKGISVKEYLMQKLEPGEDERALSQVISDAISPRRSPGDIGVVGKVKEAVTSFLRPEQEPSQSTTETTDSSSNSPISGNASQSPRTSRSPLSTSNTNPLSHSLATPMSTIKTNSSSHISQKPVSATNANSSPHIPISTNSYEVVQEGNHERILQTN